MKVNGHIITALFISLFAALGASSFLPLGVKIYALIFFTVVTFAYLTFFYNKPKIFGKKKAEEQEAEVVIEEDEDEHKD